MLAKDVLLYLSLKYNFDWDSIYKCIREKADHPTDEELHKVFEEHSINTSNWVCLLDDEYPSILKSSNKPPFVLNINSDLYKYVSEIESKYYFTRAVKTDETE